MREIRTSGSEGGVRLIPHPYPISERRRGTRSGEMRGHARDAKWGVRSAEWTVARPPFLPARTLALPPLLSPSISRPRPVPTRPALGKSPFYPRQPLLPAQPPLPAFARHPSPSPPPPTGPVSAFCILPSAFPYIHWLSPPLGAQPPRAASRQRAPPPPFRAERASPSAS